MPSMYSSIRSFLHDWKAERAATLKILRVLTDSSLAQQVSPEGWKRGGVLASLVNHQIHHRGQMTVLMRQAGLAVPGIYGPAREEWAKMGLPPMK